MTGLYIFLGIIGFIILVLSIRITVNGEFFDEFRLNVKWLFLKIDILPAKKKDKPKKEKAPKGSQMEANGDCPPKAGLPLLPPDHPPPQ